MDLDTGPRLSDEQFERFRDLILAHTGLLFGPRRRDALARGVGTAAAHARCPNLDDYCHRLQEARTDDDLWDELVEAIVVGETYFFRNQTHVDALRQHILPDLIERHRQDHRLRIWSAGCSTGEEPYSIAIMLHQLLPDIAEWTISILGTDISRRSLQRAERGLYRPWSFRNTKPDIQARYFTRRGDDGGEAGRSGRDRGGPPSGAATSSSPERGRRGEVFELRPHIRRMVTFAYLNLVEDVYPSRATNTNALDLILYRNVAIYLPQAVTQEIAARFHRSLLPQGWLMVGASETSREIYGPFAMRKLAGAHVYQREQGDGKREIGSLETWRAATASPRPLVSPSASPPDPHRHRRVAAPRRCEPAPPAKAADPDELYREGMAALERGRYERAMASFREHLERHPDSAAARYQLARTCANVGLLEEAQAWCQRAIAGDPLLSEAHYTLALIHQERGELQEAIAALKRALYLDPGFVLAHVSMATLCQEIDRPQQAAHHRSQAVRLAAQLPPGEIVSGSDGLTAGRLLTMIQSITPPKGTPDPTRPERSRGIPGSGATVSGGT